MSGQVCIYYILCLNLCKKNNTVDNFLNIQRGNHSNLWSLSTLFLMIFSLHIQFSHLGAMAPPTTNLYILDKQVWFILHPLSAASPLQPVPSCQTPAALRYATSCATMCRLSRSAKCIWREDFWNRAPTVWTSLWRTPAAWPSPAPPSPSTSPRTHLVSYTNTYNRIFLEISFVETIAWCVVVSGLFYTLFTALCTHQCPQPLTLPKSFSPQVLFWGPFLHSLPMWSTSE